MQQPYSCLIVCILPFIDLNILKLLKVFFSRVLLSPVLGVQKSLVCGDQCFLHVRFLVLNLAPSYIYRNLYWDCFPQTSLVLQIRGFILTKS